LLLFRIINKSFSARVFTYLLGAMILITVTISIFYLQFQKKYLTGEKIKDGKILTSVLASNIRLGIFAEDRKQISESLGAALSVEDVIGVCAYNVEGQLLYRETKPAWKQTGVCIKKKNVAGEFFERLKTSPGTLYREDAGKVEFWHPVRSTSSQFNIDSLYFDAAGTSSDPNDMYFVGFVGVILNKTYLQKAAQEMLKKGVLLLFFFIGLVCLATYFIIREVTKPLKRLINNVKDYGINMAAKDEVGLLADTFDNMLITLNDSFKTINILKTDLEKKVEDLEEEIQSGKKMEAALRESENKFRSISEGIADGVAMVQEGRFTWLNHSFCDIFGYSCEELLGRKAEDLLHPAQHQSPRRGWRGKISLESLRSPYQIEVSRKDGTPIVLDVKASTSIFAGKPAIEIIIRNVTEKIKSEEQRKQMELKALSLSKLASIGEIATGIAHEINQPLTFVKIAYQAALRDLDEGRFVEEEKNIASRSELKLPNVFDDALILMAERMRLRNVDLLRDIEDDLPKIYGNKMQLEQVFINLLQNSIDALEGAGSGKIRVSMKKEGDFLETVFTDTGPGVAPENEENIFEPFFTTKELEKGVGLGLAISKNIITEHNGTIAYRRIKDWGAAFIILLPIADNG
jgi:PAS domain S-box-containing protein